MGKFYELEKCAVLDLFYNSMSFRSGHTSVTFPFHILPSDVAEGSSQVCRTFRILYKRIDSLKVRNDVEQFDDVILQLQNLNLVTKV